MSIYYKGSAPGTHWAVNDARTSHGFYGPPLPMSPSNGVVNHIIRYSSPSQFTSFTASYEVALAYATIGGPGGPATAANPGYVYTVDLSHVPRRRVHVPMTLISKSLTDPCRSTVAIHHDGGQDLIHGVADPRAYFAVLTRPPRQPGPTGSTPGHLPPVIRGAAQVGPFLRDAEVLVEGAIPASHIVARVQVW